MKKTLLILSLFLLCAVAQCANIATIHSAHMNNTGKDSLASLMIVGNNTVTTYLNQNIKDLADHLDEYDAVVTSVLFNYDTPVDFAPYADRFRKYVENGGVMVYVDMNYPSHYNALESVFPEYIFHGDKNRGKSGDRAIITEPDLPIFQNIGEITNSWACVSEMSDNWTVIATDTDFNPTLAIAPIGKGFIVASTTYTEYGFPSSDFVVNLINSRGKLNTKIFADNFSLSAGYKLQGPKKIIIGKQKFTVPGADNFKVVNQNTNETFMSKNKSATVNFDHQGNYSLYAIVYDKNNKITGYSPVSSFYAEDVVLLDILYPYYNDIIQSKDPDKTFRFSCLIKDRTIKGATLHWTLKSQNKVLKTGKSAVYPQKPLEISYDISSLPQGTYSYSIVLKKGSVILKECRKDFEVLPPADYEVTFDSKHICYINGKPIFPSMLYHSGGIMAEIINQKRNPAAPEITDDDVIRNMKEWGFNIIHAGTQDENYIQKVLSSDLIFSNEMGPREDTGIIQSYIDLYKKYNTGPYYYTIDEPFGEKLPISKKMHEYIKKEDPHRPIAGAVCFPNIFRESVKYYDILMPDPYLVQKDSKTPSYSRLLDYITPALEASKGQKPLWGVLQAFGFKTLSGFALPSYEQVICQAWFYIIHRATGFCWYAYCTGEDDPDDYYNAFVLTQHPEIYKACQLVNKEVQEFFPIMHKGERIGEIKGDNPKIHSHIWTLDGVNYAVIANPEPEKQNTVFDINRPVKPFFENYNYNIIQKNGKTEISLAPYECIVIKY